SVKFIRPYMSQAYEISAFNSPLIAVALHNGHQIDPAFLSKMCLSGQQRSREEDPYTGFLAELPVSRAIVFTSRFQVDLNRIPEKAIYRRPEDAWGLRVGEVVPDAALEAALMHTYDSFYNEMALLIRQTIQVFGRFLLLDLHSYHYRREDPQKEAPVSATPEINVGTVHNHGKWQALIGNS